MITITVNGCLSENSLNQSNDSNGGSEQRSRPCYPWVWQPAFHMNEIPPPPRRPVRLHTGSAETGSDYFCALSEGCVLLHINDKDQRGSKKSLSYTHLFKKSQPHKAVGRSPKESSESKAGVGGGVMSITKERNNPRFLSTKTRAAQF